jgi:hypothetical protein
MPDSCLELRELTPTTLLAAFELVTIIKKVSFLPLKYPASMSSPEQRKFIGGGDWTRTSDF